MFTNDEFGTFIGKSKSEGTASVPRKEERVAKVRDERWCTGLSSRILSNDDRKDKFGKEAEENNKKFNPWKEHEVKTPLESTDEEFDDVYGLTISHSKHSLQQALKQFDKNVVAPKRIYFQQAMNQIEEVVNKVIVALTESNFPLSFCPMNPQCFYEFKSHNEVDIYLVVKSFSSNLYVVEDEKTTKGYAQVTVSSAILEDVSPQGQTLVKELCTKTQTGEYNLSPKNICRKLATWVSNVSKEILEENRTQYGRKITFYDSSDQGVFTFSVSPHLVNLVPTLHFPGIWPECASWLKSCSRKWPGSNVKDQILSGGIHLVPIPEYESWKFLFCDARRRLLQREDVEEKGRCLTILKAIAESDLCRPKGLLPSHLENIFMWASRKFCRAKDWSGPELPRRFLQMLAALNKCLKNGDCHEFFVPSINMFADINENATRILSSKVEDIMIDPCKYLITGQNINKQTVVNRLRNSETDNEFFY